MGKEVIEALSKARASLAAGDRREAFSQLSTVMRYPATLDEQDWVSVMREFGRIVDEPWGEHFTKAADKSRDPKTLYDLGYQLIEMQIPALAATVLTRLNTLAPDAPGVLSELCVALEDLGYHDHACAVLQKSPRPLESSPLLQYLLGFNLLMTADIPGARKWIDRATQSPDVPADVIEQIRGMFARIDGLKSHTTLDRADLRGWQFVTSGTILLHLSPHGFEEGMRGRYAFIQDQPSLCREGIVRLQNVVRAAAIPVDCIHALPDRDSMILATAAAVLFGKPLRPWPPQGSEAPGLIVAYDLAHVPLEALKSVQSHRPGQLLWSHATCWTREGPYAADVTTFLYQHNVNPWGEGRLTRDPTSQQVVTLPADESPVETLAASIVNAGSDPDEVPDLQILTQFAQAAKNITGPHAGGAFRSSGPRRRQRTASPVPSSRFN